MVNIIKNEYNSKIVPISNLRRIKQRKQDMEGRRESFKMYIKKIKKKLSASSPFQMSTLNNHYDLEV